MGKKFKKIVVWDTHEGYSRVADAEHSASEREDRIIAASLMNFWWEREGLDNLPQGYEVVTQPSRLKEIEMADCALARKLGQTHCQCGHPECPAFAE